MFNSNSSFQQNFPETHPLAKINVNSQRELQRIGMPTKKLEDWKYFSFDKLRSRQWSAESTPASDNQKAPNARSGHHFFELEIHDGSLGEVKNLKSSLPGLKIETLGDALLSNPGLESRLVDLKSNKSNEFVTALSLATAQAGVVISVAAGVQIEKPIKISQIFSESLDKVHSFVLVIQLQAGAKLHLVHDFHGATGAVVSTVTLVDIAEESSLSYLRLQEQAAESIHLARTQFQLDRKSELVSLCLDVGSSLVRHNLEAELQSEEAKAGVYGGYLGLNDAVIDHHTHIHHIKGSCETDQVYKGILGGKSRGIFNGIVEIDRNAQKANSSQLNNNLLLSLNAEADSKPQLNIYADDVKATHGSTVGAINQDELFYLQSRAISKTTATNLLTRGYLSELVYRVQNSEMQNYALHFLERAFKNKDLK
jgi:Fe-S cluster assembly protein SufD